MQQLQEECIMRVKDLKEQLKEYEENFISYLQLIHNLKNSTTLIQDRKQSYDTCKEKLQNDLDRIKRESDKFEREQQEKQQEEAWKKREEEMRKQQQQREWEVQENFHRRHQQQEANNHPLLDKPYLEILQ